MNYKSFINTFFALINFPVAELKLNYGQWAGDTTVASLGLLIIFDLYFLHHLHFLKIFIKKNVNRSIISNFHLYLHQNIEVLCRLFQ